MQEIKDNKETRVLSKPWTRAANKFEVEKLMNMRAFRDLALEYNSPTGIDYSEFIKYMSLKYAKRIDHLEECLLKEVKEAVNEKSK